MTNSRNIALVLSGGGARGLAHIGVIKEFLDSGYNITSIAGTSMGAIVGGIYAAGGLERFETWIGNLTKKDVFDLVDLSFWGTGFIKGNRVFEQIKKMVPDKNIEDLLIPFCAVATDIHNGNEVCLDSGKLFEAIRASSSIPIAFLPQIQADGSYLVDGGVLNNVPIEYIQRQEGDILVVSYVNAANEDSNSTNSKSVTNKSHFDFIKQKIAKIMPQDSQSNLGYMETMEMSIELMMNKISMLLIDKYKPDILIETPRNAFSFYEFYSAKEIIELGKKLTKSTISTL